MLWLKSDGIEGKVSHQLEMWNIVFLTPCSYKSHFAFREYLVRVLTSKLQ